MNIRKLAIPVLGLVLTIAVQGTGNAAVTIKGGMPLVYDSGGTLFPDSNLNTAWTDMQTKIHEKLDKYTNQYDLSRGIANSGVYSTQVATQSGYTGYDKYFVTIGSQVGAQSPSVNPGEIKGSFGDLRDRGDLYAGAAWQIWAMQVGIRADFLLDDLFMGLKFGYASVPYKDYKFRDVTAGLVANYILIGEAYKAKGSFVWRGLSIGSGLVFMKNDMDYNFKVATITQDITSGTLSGSQLTYTPEVTIKAESYAVSIPVELTTAIRLLWCVNLSLGAGMDISMGKSDIDLAIKGKSDLKNLPSGYTSLPQDVLIDGGTNGKGPYVARPRLMTGFGFEIGPVVLDFPMAWYFKSGFTAGVTLGFRW